MQIILSDLYTKFSWDVNVLLLARNYYATAISFILHKELHFRNLIQILQKIKKVNEYGLLVSQIEILQEC